MCQSPQRLRRVEVFSLTPRLPELAGALTRCGCGFGAGCGRAAGGELLTGRDAGWEVFLCGCGCGRLTTLGLGRFCERDDEEEFRCGWEKSWLTLVWPELLAA